MQLEIKISDENRLLSHNFLNCVHYIGSCKYIRIISVQPGHLLLSTILKEIKIKINSLYFFLIL